MTRPSMLMIPKVSVPVDSARDYACGSYNGNKNFSCQPYGSKGNIDAPKKDNSGWVIGLVTTVVGGVIGGIFAT